MNPRQRRGLVLMSVSVLGAIGVFVSVANYVAEVETQIGPMTGVLRLSEDARPYVPVTAEMVELVEVPERWKPSNALASAVELDGRVPVSPLPAGTLLQEGILVEPPHLREGQRELAIMVDAEAGVGGMIRRGSIVDIYATFAGSDRGGAHATIVIQDAEIIDVGSSTTASEQDETGVFSQGEVVPVTFALSVAESLRLAYVESFAHNVLLVLRAPDDRTRAVPPDRIYQPDGVVVDDAGDGQPSGDDE